MQDKRKSNIVQLATYCKWQAIFVQKAAKCTKYEVRLYHKTTAQNVNPYCRSNNNNQKQL